MTYNGDNRPVLRTRTNTISMSYDCMDRRVTKNAQRFACDGHLQIADNSGKFSWFALTNIAERFSVDVRGNTNRTWSALDPTSATRTTWMRQAGIGNLALLETTDGETTLSVDTGCVTNRTTYDAFRRRTSTTDGRGNTTTYAYDILGHLAAVTDAATNTTHYAYDAMGHVTEMTNALGNVTFTRYDTRGNKTYEGGATYPVHYGYDVFGNKVSMTTYRNESSSVGDTTTWLYDEASGLVTNKVYADGMGPSYDYDANGRLTHRTWARGIITEYAYDGWGDLTTMEYSDDTCSITNAYDALGRKTSVTDAAGEIEYAYDVYGSVTNETRNGLGGLVLTRHYDDCGRNVGYSIDGVRTTTIFYDAASGALNGMHTTEGDFSWQYLVGSHLKSRVIYPNNINVDYTYEANRDLLISVTNQFSSSVHAFTYAYDALSRPVSRNADSFGYNGRGDVTEALINGNAETHSYDSIGNSVLATFQSVTNTYVANALNQYTSIAGEATYAPTYNADGDLLTLAEWSFTYDADSRLRTVSSNGVILVTNTYDGQGRRVRKETPEDVTTFLYDGRNVIRETVVYTTGNVDTFEYLWGLDLSGTLQGAGGVGGLRCVRRNGTSYFPLVDANGNITSYADATGAIVAEYVYDAFGRIISQSGSLADVFRHRFSSKCFDHETGLYYYGYRFYSPMLMRWLNRDPLCEEVGMNLYGFCSNNGISRFDYLGHAHFEVRVLRGVGGILPYSCFANIIGVVPSLILDLGLADKLNIEILHEHLFFDDGTNIGYSKEGFLTKESREEYSRRDYREYDDCIMKEAVSRVSPPPYSLIGFGRPKYNCQDYADSLRRMYDALKDVSEVKCKCKKERQ